MGAATTPRHLNQICTSWTRLRLTASGDEAAKVIAFRATVEKYREAVWRRIYAKLGKADVDAVNEIYQEFFLKLLAGKLAGATPSKGRFRDYIDQTLDRMVSDHYRGKQRGPKACDALESLAGPMDRDEVAADREALIREAWSSLWQIELRTGKPLHTALRLSKVEALSNREIAERLRRRGGRLPSPNKVSQYLGEAREKFAESLVQSTVAMTAAETRDEIEEALAKLGLLDFCRGARKRYRLW
jgi:RNA polymerase sigma factor (sigma-70 family)